MKVLYSTDSGAELLLTDGDTFEVRLVENASTGYQWSVAGLPDTIELLDDDVVSPAPVIPGSQGLHRFRFVVRGSPSGRLAMELRRSWEQAGQPEDQFEVRIASTPSGGSALEDRPDERGIEDLDDTI